MALPAVLGVIGAIGQLARADQPTEHAPPSTGAVSADAPQRGQSLPAAADERLDGGLDEPLVFSNDGPTRVLRVRVVSQSTEDTAASHDAKGSASAATPMPALPLTEAVMGETEKVDATLTGFRRKRSALFRLRNSDDQTSQRSRHGEPPRLNKQAQIRWLGSATQQERDAGFMTKDSAEQERTRGARQTISDVPDADGEILDQRAHVPLVEEAAESGNSQKLSDGSLDDALGQSSGSEAAEVADRLELSDQVESPSSRRNATPRAENTERQDPPFSAEEIALRDKIQRCLQYFKDHPENVVRRGPWALMHAILPYGANAEVIAGSRRVNIIGWLCYNGLSARQRMFTPTRNGFKPNVGPGVQGHEGQFLAILAQSRVPDDFPLRIGSRQYTVRDLVRYEMATCRERSELTFKLIGLSYYLDQDARWRDNRGQPWTLEKLLVEEMTQPIHGAACGGTHRLMGLSYALVQRKKAGYPIEGNWARVEAYLKDYINYAITLQNPDGSFSTNWLEGRGNAPDVERKVQTTGHITEWLVFYLPDEYLRTDEIRSAVQFLADAIGSDLNHDWPIGPRGHALRALALYDERVFRLPPGDSVTEEEGQQDALVNLSSAHTR